MITLMAKISMVSKGALDTIDCNISRNNVSSDILSVLGQKRNALNPFITGASKLGDGSTFVENVDYYIGKEQSDSIGTFANPYVINIRGKEIDTLTIAFDTTNKRHPHYIDVNGTRYYDNNAIHTITGLGGLSSVKITVDNWNTPQHPLVITGVYINIDILVDKRNLISLNSSIMSRENLKLASYGIISNSGNLEFVDTNGEIKDYAEQGILTSNLKVPIMLTNTLSKTSEQVGVFETRDWDYDNENRTVSVSLKDDLEEWQDIQIEGFSYDPRNASAVLPNKSAKDLYIWLYGKTPSKYEMTSFDDLEEKLKSILTSTTIPYPLLKSGNLWYQWQKLCELCGLCIYKNNQGKTVCTYTNGS